MKKLYKGSFCNISSQYPLSHTKQLIESVEWNTMREYEKMYRRPVGFDEIETETIEVPFKNKIRFYTGNSFTSEAVIWHKTVNIFNEDFQFDSSAHIGMIFADKIYSEENRNCAERGRCIFK
jgi:hypothetical protein